MDTTKRLSDWRILGFITLILTGASAYSINAYLLTRYPALRHRCWFQWIGSAPWHPDAY